MSNGSSTYLLRLPASLKAAVADISREDGTSINQFVTPAVAEKVLPFLALSALVLAGCATTYMAELQLVPERIAVNGEEISVLGDAADYADSAFAVSAEVLPKTLAVSEEMPISPVVPSSVNLHVQNGTPEVCEIVWDRSGVVDITGHTVEVARGETPLIDNLDQQRAHIVLPGSKSTVSLFPLDDDRDLLGLDSFDPRHDSFLRRQSLARQWANKVATFVGHPISVTATFRFATLGARTVSFDYRISGVLFHEVKTDRYGSKSLRQLSAEELFK